MFSIGLGAVAFGKCGDLDRRRSGKGDVIACLTSSHPLITIQPCRIAIPNPAGERTRDSAGEGSAPLPRRNHRSFQNSVMLSEAQRFGIDDSWTMARSRSIPGILGR